LLILEILHDEGKTPVSHKVGITDKEEGDLELCDLAELDLVDRTCADEVPLGLDINGLAGGPLPILHLASIEDIELGNLHLLVDLLLLKFRILFFVGGDRFLASGVFQIHPLEQVGQIGPDRITLKQRQTGKPYMIGMKLPRFFKTQERRIDQGTSLIEDNPTIEIILRHLDLWEGLARSTDRAPPLRLESEYVREPFYDDIPFGPDNYAE